MTKIALFGTSADPPTEGHKTILKWLSEHYDWVAIWASDNPFKEHQTSLQHRTEMLRLVISEIEVTHKNISLQENLSHYKSLVSLERAKKIWGENATYSLVIGSDLVSQIRRWYHAEILLKQVELLIIPRPGYLIKNEDLKALDNLGGKWQIADLSVPAVSSTAYREQGDNKIVPKPVQDYIHREKLYA
jgi:nicotinate-nucleotide adenylyltransferase